jgi:hypothetical protein
MNAEMAELSIRTSNSEAQVRDKMLINSELILVLLRAQISHSALYLHIAASLCRQRPKAKSIEAERSKARKGM